MEFPKKCALRQMLALGTTIALALAANTTTAQSVTSTSVNADLTSAEHKNEQISNAVMAQWGSWGALAGTSWLQNGAMLFSYKWEIPGEVMTATVTDGASHAQSRISLSADGNHLDVKFARGNSITVTFPRPGIAIQDRHNGTRIVMRFAGNRIVMTDQKQQDGQWVDQASYDRVKLSSQETNDKLAQFHRKAVETRSIWGDLIDLNDRHFVGDLDGNKSVVSFREGRLNKYRSINISMSWNYNKDGYYVDIYRDTDKNRMRLKAWNGENYHLHFTSEGGIFFFNHLYRALPNGTLEVAEGGWDNSSNTFKPKGQPTIWNEVSAESYNRWLNELKQAEAAKKAEHHDHSGLIGGLIGAAMGGVAASAGDLSTSDTLGVIMKGAAAATTDSNAKAALNSGSDSFLNAPGSAVEGAGAAGGGVLAATGGASYPTKPNLATNACPGFTMDNYRQQAFQSGGDTQLFTMCGQAFEYYHMYLNAIAEGYSEADANRTYAAHEKAALNAQNFAKNWSAN